MLELSTLKFTVDTSQLEKALGLVDKLAPAMQGAATASKKMQTATEEGGKSTERLAKAAENAGSKLTGVERSLERQAIKNKILRGETVELTDAQVKLDRAFTAGQAGQLATAKLSGATAEQFKKLASSFRDFNAISGANPFDKTLGGITKLRSEIQELASVNGLMNSGFNVTREQARLLQRDLNSLAQTMQLAGKSQEEIVAASKAHTSVFAEEANRLNNQIAIAKESEVQARKVAAAQFTQAKAYKALEAEMQRVDAVMAEMNNEYGMTVHTGERAAAAVAKYATMLKRAGVEGVQAAAMLETYRKKTQQIASQDESRAATRLSRALTPQISDVAVSVAGGMPLHLVIMQQGLQIRDLIAQSGVSQQKMQEVFKTAGADMVKSIGGTIAALGTLVYGTLVDAGKAVTDFGFKMFGLGTTIDDSVRMMPTWAKGLEMFRNAMVVATTVGIAGLLTGMASLLVMVVQLYKEQSKLNIAMNTTGASLGFTVGQANEYIDKMNNVGVSGRKVAEALSIIGKEGGFAGKTLDMVVESAVMLESAAGIAIEETIKNFAKLRDDPVKAVRELGKETGYFSDELSTNIRKLEEQGNSVLAAELAMKAYADGTKQSAEAIRNNYGFLETLFYGIGNAAKSMWDSILGIGRPENDTTVLKTEADRLAKQLEADPDNQFLQYQAEMAASAYRTAKALDEQTKQKKLNAEASKLTDSVDKLIISNMSKEEKFRVRMNELLDEENKLAMAGLLTADRQAAINRERQKAFKDSQDKPRTSGASSSEQPYQWQEKLNDAMNSTIAKTQELNAVEKVWADIQNDKKFLLLAEGERNEARKEAVRLIEQANDALSKSKLAEYTKEFDKFLIDAQAKAKDLDFEQSTFGFDAERVEQMRIAYAEMKDIEAAAFKFYAGAEEAKTKLQGAELQTRLEQLGKLYEKEVELAQKKSKVETGSIANKKQLEEIEKQKKAYEDMWRDVDKTAEDIFIDIAQNGEDAFKRIGDSIEKYLLKMLYEMTVKQWIIQVSGVNTGAGSTNAISSALGSISVGGGATLGSLGQYFSTGFMSAGSGAGVGTTASAGASIGGANGAAMQAGAYAAPIAGAAAGMYANRRISGGYQMDNKHSQAIQDAGVLIATAVGGPLAGALTGVAQGIQNRAFGRKLTQSGIQGTFTNGEVDSNAYQFQKGGLFRSNKTTTSALDDPARQAMNQQLKNLQDSAAAMARALGQGDEAIKNFTGQVSINLQGLSQEDAARKMAEELRNFQAEMLASIPGIGKTKDELIGLIKAAQDTMVAAGITSEGMADIITQGMLGRLSEAQVGEQLAEMVIGGIYNTMISPFAMEIANTFTTQILEPMFEAIASGVPISQAISQASIDAVVQKAQEAANAINAVMSDPGFRAAIGSIQKAIGGIAKASTRRPVAAFGAAAAQAGAAAAQAAAAAAQAAAEAKRAAEQIKQAWTQIGDTITDEIRRIRGELVQDDTRGMSYLQSQFAIATAAAKAGDQEAAKQLPALSQAMLEMAKSNAVNLAELQKLQGYTVASLLETRAFLSKKYGFSIPQFAVGTNYVPSDMLAMIHEGEAIVPKAFNPAAGGVAPAMLSNGNVDMTALVQEVQMLRAEVRAVVTHTSKTARVLDRVSPNGDSIAISTLPSEPIDVKVIPA